MRQWRINLVFTFLISTFGAQAQQPEFRILETTNQRFEAKRHGVNFHFGLNPLFQRLERFDFSYNPDQWTSLEHNSDREMLTAFSAIMSLGYCFKEVMEIGGSVIFNNHSAVGGNAYFRWYIESGGSEKLRFFLGTSVDYHRPYVEVKPTDPEMGLRNYTLFVGSEHLAQTFSAGLFYRTGFIGYGLEYIYGWHIRNFYSSRLFFNSAEPENNRSYHESTTIAGSDFSAESGLFRPYFSRIQFSLSLFL